MRRLTALLLVLLAGCGGTPLATPATSPSRAPSQESSQESSQAPSPAPSPAPSQAPSQAPLRTAPVLGTHPPAWLGGRPIPVDRDGIGLARPTPPALRTRRFTLPDRLPELPGAGFAAVVRPAPPGVLARSTWGPSCPVAATDLRWIRLTFRGFDDARHTGELLTHAAVAEDLVSVFRTLYRSHFPLEEMRIATRADLDAAPTGDGNDSESFVCRPVVGQTAWSQHAYGLAVDVNPFQNPYVDGARIVPELASAYVDRSHRRPGMIEPGDVVVRAFERIGWTWGGTWSSKLDLQHFSANGR